MSNLDLSIVYAKVPGFPTDEAVAAISATITGLLSPAVTISGPPDTPDITFPNVVADTYTFSVQAINAGGHGIGTAVTGSFTVTGVATISLSLPSSVSPSQS